MDVVLRHLGTNARKCDTHVAPLPGLRADATAADVRLDDALPWREQDVTHAVRHEFAERVADVLMRRTTLAYERKDQGRAIAPRVAVVMGELLRWTDAGVKLAIEEYDRDAARVFGMNA